jgi:hypothetical protein
MYGVSYMGKYQDFEHLVISNIEWDAQNPDIFPYKQIDTSWIFL